MKSTAGKSTAGSVDAAAVRSSLYRHIDRLWQVNHKDLLEWQAPGAEKVLPRFRVARIHPANHGEPFVFLSCGAWEASADQGLGQEFFLLAPSDDEAHVDTVAAVALAHAAGRGMLQLGSLVPLGRPWLPGSACDHLLVSLPYPYGPNLERLSTGTDLDLAFRWLVPITATEADLARAQGAERLEARLEAARADFLDPRRAPVA